MYCCHKTTKKQTILTEFAERKGIKERLSELGVDDAQSYAIHKPQAFEEIFDLS